LRELNKIAAASKILKVYIKKFDTELKELKIDRPKIATIFNQI
jgi:hypothetical protein